MFDGVVVERLPFSGVFVFSFSHGARSENALLML